MFFTFRSNKKFTILLQKPPTETMSMTMSTHKSTRPRPHNFAFCMHSEALLDSFESL